MELCETAIANAMDLLSCCVSNPEDLLAVVCLQYGEAVMAEALRRIESEDC